MENKPIRILLIGLLLFFIHVLFTKNINFFELINPQIFPIFFLLFPRSFNTSFLLIVGFLYAFLIDFFSVNLGVSIVPSVLICFLKPFILKLIYNRDASETPIISVEIQGMKFILRYLFISLFIYHIVYFFTEVGNFYNIFYVVLKSFLSTVLTVLLYGTFMFLFSTHSNKREIKI